MFKSIKKRINNNKGGGGGAAAADNNVHMPSGRSTIRRQGPSHTVSSGSTGSNSRSAKDLKKKKNSQDAALSDKDLSTKVEHLARFDACVEAADALAAAAGQRVTQVSRRDSSTGLMDCSVLVSPDGDLLLVPQGQHQTLFQYCLALTTTTTTTTVSDNNNNNSAHGGGGGGGSSTEADASERSKRSDTLNNGQQANLVSELMLTSKSDYQSAVFLGNDLHPAGDKSLNGFSAKGWSVPATSMAVQQSLDQLNDLVDFCEVMVLNHKDAAARASNACDNLLMAHPAIGGTTPILSSPTDWEIIDPKATDFEMNASRVGPLLATQGSLGAAMVALEHYHATVAESEANRWRTASLNRKGLLPALQKSVANLQVRASMRQSALEETSRRARLMEDRLRSLKDNATKRWEAVYQAEDMVTMRVEEIMQQRSREREIRRMEQLREDEVKQSKDTANGVLGATSEEIWDIVSSVAESMDNGSFEPLDMPQAPLSTPRDKSMDEDSPSVSAANSMDKQDGAPHHMESIPLASRENIEHEVGLPELRAAALAADEEIEDASGSLLNIISNLDTTRRSARVAAETCLVGASHAQADCIQSMIKLERENIEDRLHHLDELERVAENINVRADLDAYITADKQGRGGCSHLGDDDDGGVASALAVLSSHVDGNMGQIPVSSMKSDTGVHADEDATTPEMLEKAVESLFEVNDAFKADTPESSDVKKARLAFAESVDSICKISSENSLSARAKRSSICYSLNSKRGSNAEIKTPLQFDALCRVFDAILTGCNGEDAGVSNAKMCMMLAQSFYMVKEGDTIHDVQRDKPVGSPARVARSRRVYIKSRLSEHALWSKDDFWDQALYQCVSESLTHSGVMANFERSTRRTNGRKSEWTQTRKTKWYDLNYTERIEAASQVHAVVFAQLGALAHSMIEFGCGLERSCAFVRRMAIRNQLPSSQRTMLLQHLMDRNDVERKESIVIDSESDEAPPAAEPTESEPDESVASEDETGATETIII